jgi:hypothetical protein
MNAQNNFFEDLHRSCVWCLIASVAGGLCFSHCPLVGFMCCLCELDVRTMVHVYYVRVWYLGLPYPSLLSLYGRSAAIGAVPPFPSLASHISLLQPFYLLRVIRRMTVTTMKYCSCFPFPPFLPLDINIATETCRWYYMWRFITFPYHAP